VDLDAGVNRADHNGADQNETEKPEKQNKVSKTFQNTVGAA
jgi:hypothetical protein